jgi:hypothetical protein
MGIYANAQDNLSLSDAIAIGLKNNYQIQIAGKNTQLSDSNCWQKYRSS